MPARSSPVSDSSVLLILGQRASMVRLLCVTCNVGALAKSADVSEEAVAATVTGLCDRIQAAGAAFVAVHFQECVHVHTVLQPLVRHASLAKYSAKHVICDVETNALCSLYMHDPAAITATAQPLGQESPGAAAVTLEGATALPLSVGLSHALPKDVLPFPSNYKQKGLLHTRWALDGALWGFTNVHLPHDNDNWHCIALQPSPTAQNRYASLQWAVETCAVKPTDRVLLFGDVNFRPSLRGVARAVYGAALEGDGPSDPTPSGAKPKKPQMPPEAEMAEVSAAMGRHGASVEARAIHFGGPAERFQLPAAQNPLWAHDEGRRQPTLLREAPLEFPPSYGYDAFEEGLVVWKTKRVPAWPDRVFLTPGALQALQVRGYGLATGIACPIRDHKPVYLAADVAADGADMEWNCPCLVS